MTPHSLPLTSTLHNTHTHTHARVPDQKSYFMLGEDFLGSDGALLSINSGEEEVICARGAEQEHSRSTGGCRHR